MELKRVIFRRVRRALNVLFVVVSVAVVCTALVQNAKARVQGAAHDAAALLLGFAADHSASSPRGVVFNGQELAIVVGQARHSSVAGFLEPMAEKCRKSEARAVTSWLHFDPALVSITDNAGVFVCLGGVVPSGVTDSTSVPAGAQTHSQKVVFLRAERSEGNIHFTGVAAAGSLNVAALFPQQGDAPGADPVSLPRPPSGRRVASMVVHGEAYGAWVYADVVQNGRELRTYFTERLGAQGWRQLAVLPDGGLPGGDVIDSDASVFSNGNQLAIVHSVPERGARTVTLLITQEANHGG